MPCGNLNFSCGYTKTNGKSTRTIGRLAYLNKYSKPSPTRNYSSEDARARSIRRRVGTNKNRNGVKQYGPLFGLKQNNCPGSVKNKHFVHANHGNSSDVIYFKRISGGSMKINPCDSKGC
jgi:hypothetical protein